MLQKVYVAECMNNTHVYKGVRRLERNHVDIGECCGGPHGTSCISEGKSSSHHCALSEVGCYPMKHFSIQINTHKV